MTHERVREIAIVKLVDEYVRLSGWKWLEHVYRQVGQYMRYLPCLEANRREKKVNLWRRLGTGAGGGSL